VLLQVSDAGAPGTCSHRHQQQQQQPADESSGPAPGVCPRYIRAPVTSFCCSSGVDEGPVPLVVSPSLPAAVDLTTVCHVDEHEPLQPLNLSTGRPACPPPLPPPPAHCHSLVAHYSQAPCHGTTAGVTDGCAGAPAAVDSGSGSAGVGGLRSLDVLWAAAALRAEIGDDQPLTLPAAVTADAAVTLSSLVARCRQVRPFVL